MRSLLLVPLLALAGGAFAQTFPPVPRDGTVFDGAEMLSPEQERAISDLSRDFQRDTGGPIAVATLSSLDRYEAKGMGIQAYSTALYNQWRVGRRETNSGILLVVAKADRKVWAALGTDWGRDYDQKAQNVVRGTITPLFKQGRFDEGILQGCQALARLADPDPGAAGVAAAGPPVDQAPFGAAPPEPALAPEASPMPWIFGGGLCCLAVPVLLVVAIVAATKRWRMRGTGYGGYGHGGAVHSASYDDRRDDAGSFLAGMVAGQAMSGPDYVYDPGPSFDDSPSYDSGGYDSGGSDSSFDSGSSDGGGGGGDW